MVSVLIPIYNQDCTSLIDALLKQIKALDVPIEVIAIDDASTLDKEKNKQILTSPDCTYIELAENIGRAAIRNKLATLAQFPYLIFIDCDTYPASDTFLASYVQGIREQEQLAFVLCGGYKYRDTPPLNHQQLFRWTYGKQREEFLAIQRNKTPYKSFSSFNFCMPKAVFSSIQFDESIVGYGHEDTWFGIALKENGVLVKHIDNELYQVYIDDTSLYIEKTKNAVKNLHTLYLDTDKNTKFGDIRLMEIFKRTQKMRLCGFLKMLYGSLSSLCERNFHSNKPSLALFDMYRLGLLCAIHLDSKKQKKLF